MPVSCAPVCTNNDVVAALNATYAYVSTGLVTLSGQLQGLGAFLFIAGVLVVVALYVLVGLTWWRRA